MRIVEVVTLGRLAFPTQAAKLQHVSRLLRRLGFTHKRVVKRQAAQLPANWAELLHDFRQKLCAAWTADLPSHLVCLYTEIYLVHG